MRESSGRDRGPDGGAGEPSVSPDVAVPGADAEVGEGLAPDEAFQALASEVRVAVLVALRSAEEPLPFDALRRAAGVDSSAGFAYHLRQLDGHFVRKGTEGYVLTPAGRRVAAAIDAGLFTDGTGEDRAS